MPKMILVDVKAIAERRKARETAFMEMLTDEQCMAYKGLREFRRDKESYVNDYDKSASEVLDFMYYLRDLCTTPSPKTGTISLSKTEQQPMSWKNLAQTSLSDALVKHRVALEALDGIHPLIDWKPIEQQMSGIHAKKQGEQAWPPLLMFKALLLQRSRLQRQEDQHLRV